MLLADDDEGSEPVEPVVERGPEEIAEELSERTLTESLEKEDAGLRAAYPEGWRRSESSGIITLESPDRCIAISLSSPATAAQADQLLRDSIKGVQASFKRAEIRRSQQRTVGGRPTSGALIAVRNKQGKPVIVELAVSKGKQLAHLTQLALRSPPCEAAAPQMDLIIESIEYSR